MTSLSKIEGTPKASLRLACPFACRYPEHYGTTEGHTSNCVTNSGFSQRQVCRQHLVSEHYALCPKCFMHKKAANGTPEKNFKNVKAWRHEHLQVCKGPVRGQGPDPKRYPLDHEQAIAFEKLHENDGDEGPHKDLVKAHVKCPKDYEFEWWKAVYRALFGPEVDVPEPNTRYFIPRPEFQKEVDKAVAIKLAELAEILVHATTFFQVGLRVGVNPDPDKYRLLEPYKEILAPKLDMLRPPGQIKDNLRAGGMLKDIPHPALTGDSGYASHPEAGGLFPRSPQWSPVALDHGGSSTSAGQGEFSHTLGGGGAFAPTGNYGFSRMNQDLGMVWEET